MAKLDLIQNKECFRCSGTGDNFDWKTNKKLPGPCPSCNGWGSELGEDGEAIATFLSERFGIEMKKQEPPHA